MSKFYSDDEVRAWFVEDEDPTLAVREGHRWIAGKFRDLAVDLNNLLPEGPDKTAALRMLRYARHRAHDCVTVAQKLFEGE